MSSKGRSSNALKKKGLGTSGNSVLEGALAEFESNLGGASAESVTPKPKKRKALGRGLAALMTSNAVEVSADGIPQQAQSPDKPSVAPVQTATAAKAVTTSGTEADANLRFVSIELLRPTATQPRKLFDESEIEELATSIKRSGVLQPILVRPRADSEENKGAAGYQIVAGERRYRASKKAGLTQVPVTIRELDDREVLEISIVENVQRSNLDPIEEAAAYRRLRDDFSMGLEEIAESVGKDRATISNCIRLLQLPKAIQQLLINHRLSAGHARALLSLDSIEAQRGLATQIIGESLSVRAAERLARDHKTNQAAKNKSTGKSAKAKSLNAQESELEDRFRAALGTKVQLKRKASGRGEIKISFFSDEELGQLLDTIEGSKQL